LFQAALFQSAFIELQPISEYEENIELGIDLTPNVDNGYVPLHTEEEEEEVLMPPEDDENSKFYIFDL
jgi:hypothetical protein